MSGVWCGHPGKNVLATSKEHNTAYKGDTVKFRISSPNGTWRTVDTLEAVDAEIDKLVNSYGVKWVAVDRIETTRIRLEEKG